MNNTPIGWQWAELGEVSNVQWGNTSLTKSSYVDEGYPAFSATGQDGRTAHFEHDGPGIVLSAIGARCGKCFLADERWTSIKNTISMDNCRLDRDFLFHYLNDENRWPHKGGAQPFITLKVARELLIPVPPFRQQGRIVAKINSLATKSRRARDHLGHLPRLVEKYKQAVLAVAFRGDLTRDWQNADGLQISWRKALAGELFEWSSGKNLPTKQLVAGSVPVIGGNGVNGQHNQSLIDYPTVVVGRVGAQCGNVHLSIGRAWITDNAIYASQISPEIDLQFAVLLLRSKNLNELAGGSGQPYVSQTILNAIELALPSVKEQKEIVRRIEHAFSWIDLLASEATKARRLVDHLDQAVLAKAFQGELVPQDPSDEPASVLLERIRAERATFGRSTGTRGRPRRTA